MPNNHLDFEVDLLPVDNATYNLGSKDKKWNINGNAASDQASAFAGTCATAAGTSAKAVTCASFTAGDLAKGVMVYVVFSYTNTATSSLTLNVNSTGAKSIKYLANGAVANIPVANYFVANQTYRFVYDGTNWVCEPLSHIVTDDNAGNVTIY